MGAWKFVIGSAPFGHLQMGFVAIVLGLELALCLNVAMVPMVITVAVILTPALRSC